MCDRNCNVVAPIVTGPDNANETKLFPGAFNKLKDIAKAVSMDVLRSFISLDGAYDSKKIEKMIFNVGMAPNINENKSNRNAKKRGRNRFFDKAIFEDQLRTIVRVFSLDDEFKRLFLWIKHTAFRDEADGLYPY